MERPMQAQTDILPGDTPGSAYSIRVLRFRGSDPSAPKAYLQAALHGEELPGTVALHALAPMLAEAEAAGRLRGDVTLVPLANPIGLGQELLGSPMGRFSFSTRTNFNRDFPLHATGKAPALAALDDGAVRAEVRLKAHLLRLSQGHDIVLDLHCDDEGLSYLYVHARLWPGLRDLAAALGSRAVLIWDDTSDGAFEEAAVSRHADLAPGDPALQRIAVSTVELRGIADVAPEMAASDAAGLFAFLAMRGVVDGPSPSGSGFDGPVTPLDHVEMVRTPVAGAILYHVVPGMHVKAGDRLASILTAPGEPGGATDILAPQDGLILTRRSRRTARPGEDVVKLLGSRPSKTAKAGALEA
jgi:predicted deacylase